MAEVKLEGVRKAYGGQEVLRDIDLSISHGEFVVFVGPSGSGKSTLLRMIGGLERISGGKLLIDSRVVNDVGAADRNLGMVFQSYALYPHLTVRENLAFPLRMAKAPADRMKARVEEAAELLQIAHLLERKPRQLSGGQRQRVAIGRAIVREPLVFLFDEPLSNLDTELRVQMRVQIAKLHRQLGNTMIYVTHDQVEAMTMADKIVVLRDGNIEQIGSPHELYHHPNSRFVAGFIGSPKMNFLDVSLASADDDQVRVRLPAGHEVSLPADGSRLRAAKAGSLGIRPDDFIAPVDRADAIPLEIDVDFVEHLGNVTYLYGTLAGEPLVAKAPAGSNARSGQRLPLAVLASDCHLFDGEGHAVRRLGVPRAWN